MREFKVSQGCAPAPGPRPRPSAYPFLASIPGNEWALQGQVCACFTASHTFLAKSLSWKQIPISSFSMRSAQWREKRIPRGDVETQGKKGVEAAAPTQCVS